MRLRLTQPGLLGDMLRGAVEAFLLGIMVLAGLVLLAACANLASLLAARTTDRHFELAIRLSIGAGRGRILRQLLTEALFLSMLGGAAGLALAFGLLRLIARVPPPIDFPLNLAFAPDGRVLLFACAASIATGLIFGVAPARRAVRTDPSGALRGMSAGRAPHRRWAGRDLLLAGQVALCCFLVTACFVSLRGLSRDFTWHDDHRAPLVGIVNETFAKVVLRTRDAVGRRYREGSGPLVEIIGMVEDGKYRSLTEQPTPALFRSAAQSYNDSAVLLLRSRLPAAEAAVQLRQIMTTLDPQLPVYALGSINQLLELAYFPARAATIALGAFGLLAVMLAVTGIYGLAAYTVSRRVREIGVRVAVGAQPWQVLRSVMGRTGVLLLAGSCAGLVMGVAGTRLLASIVYHATPRDPVVLGAVAATMILVALLATWVPARRAVSVDPIRSLRHE